MKRLLLLLPLLAAVAFGQNLLVNGDFEQDVSVGWQVDSLGTATITRDTGYQPDADYEVMDSLVYQGHSRLYQIVDVPGTRLTLSFWARFEVSGANASCWPVASVAVEYYDAANTLLGETRVYCHNSYCTWAPCSTMSLIEVTDTDWTRYSLDISSELSQHLPGVNPADVRRLGVALFDTTAGG